MKKPIVKQLKKLMEVCDKHKDGPHREYFQVLKKELEEGYKIANQELEALEYEADTEYLNLLET